MNRTHSTLFAGLAALALAVGAASAQDMPAAAGSAPMAPMHNMQHMQRLHGTQYVKGSHRMPATVTSADPATGLVKVDSAGMALVVHFPPPAMKDLKPGDKITLHLGFSQP
ncbi:MAG TPA: hypothetical protein VFR91_08480 [Dyella sp.]|nr:hypothetical protein [Dyella sp.]